MHPALLLAALGAFAAAVPGWTAAQQREPAPGSLIPDSIRQHLADGRHWRASLSLRALLAPLESAAPADRLTLARAEAGWRNWNGAIAALSAGGDEGSETPPLLYLRAGARAAAGDSGGAAADYERFLAAARAGASTSLRERLVALSRVARRHGESARRDEAAAALEELAAESPAVADWTALEVARAAASAGDAAFARRALALVDDPAARRWGWSFEADALAQSGDTARALQALRATGPPLEAAARARVQLLGREWRYRLALRDTAGAVASMEELLRASTRGREALDAARAHWRIAENSGPGILRLVAAAFGRSAEFGLAARAWTAAVRAGARLSESERMARARAYNGSGDRTRAVEVYRELSASDDPAVGAAALSAWAAIRTRQGRAGDAATLRARLVERYPSSSEAVDVVFFRGDDHQDAGRLDQAVAEYRRVASMSPGSDRAGLARMRWGQIHLARGEAAEAAAVFRGYLADFPDGRRWEEASYWAARAGDAAGDTVGSGALVDRVLEESPMSYYAQLASQEWRGGGGASDLPVFARNLARGPTGAEPDWLAAEMAVLAALDEAGLERGAETQLARMRDMAGDSVELAMRLAEALNRGGRTTDGIALGWELRRRGVEWSRALLEVVYPFPHRALVTSRAEELGLDPFLVAGLIRQESAFSAPIASPAGAIGLMQVMPATGRQLAASEGPRGYRTESLRTAEVNVHLGTKFLADLLERYDGDIPLVLSAYNAGPSRANRWRRFPEAEDPRRFTERIPFAETRGYVKNVVRNRALYRWLYGPA